MGMLSFPLPPLRPLRGFNLALVALAATAPKDGVFAQKLVQKNSEVHGDDRHSKNGYPVNPLQKPKPIGVMPRHQ